MEKEDPTTENQAETLDVTSLIELAQELGFQETEEMQQLRTSITEALKKEEDCMAMYKQYEELGLELAREDPTQKTHIGLILIQASMLSHIPDPEQDFYAHAINDALIIAKGEGYSDIEQKIKTIPLSKTT